MNQRPEFKVLGGGGYTRVIIPVGETIIINITAYKPVHIYENTNNGYSAVVLIGYPANMIKVYGIDDIESTLTFSKVTGQALKVTNAYSRDLEVFYKIS